MTVLRKMLLIKSLNQRNEGAVRAALAAAISLCLAGPAAADSGDFHSSKAVASTGTPDDKGRGHVKFNGPEAEIKARRDSATVVLRYPMLGHVYVPHGTDADDLLLSVRFRDNGPDAQVIVRLKSLDHANNITTHLVLDSNDFARSGDYQWESVTDGGPSLVTLHDRMWYVEVTLKKTGPRGDPGCRFIIVRAREE